MDVRQLQRFVAVADGGSFSKAAEVLAASQPVLTRSVHLLEESLGVPLFERGPRGVTLTSFGEELLPRARAIINEMDRATTVIQQLRRKSHLRVSIGVTPSFIENVVRETILKIIKTEPEIQIRFVEGSFGSILNRLREGELDLAIGTRDAYADLTDLKFESLVEDHFNLVARPDHPIFASGKEISYADLTDLKWVVPDEPGAIRRWQAVFERKGLPIPDQTVITSSTSLIKSCLMEDDFLSVVGYLTFPDEISSQKLRVIPTEGTGIRRPAGLFFRSEIPLTAGGVTFVRMLKKVIAPLSNDTALRLVK